MKQLRSERGWTQEQAASACDIGYKLYQLYELGIRDNPSLKNVEKISRGFGLDISEFLAPHLPKLRPIKSAARKPKARHAT